ncbi:hypothetical protein PsYK624_088030 [Phanerochaete sordida]|uniref:Transmembrane protein n=1 Tax=Phanerochaete sordida TaxID=48140 RepID=A0A9P3GD16_9APHY|nr:hypothetical protein PsYK624_088030 [Phanerochaete sordida]
MAVQWEDAAVQALCGFVFRLVGVFTTGFYVWYWLLSLHKVEWELVTRAMRPTWAHVSYLAARYFELATVLAFIITTNVQKMLLNCDSAVGLKVTATFGNMAVAASSTNLGLRAVVMWKEVRFMKAGLAIVCAAHGIVAFITGFESVQARWDPLQHVCMVVTSKGRSQLLGFYTFTLIWDIVILAFTLAGMQRQGLHSRSPLWTTVVTQGLGYALISCSACIPAIIMLWLDLNNTMNVILALPSGTICVITSSAFVTSLLGMCEPDASSSLASRPKSTRPSDPRRSVGGSHALTTHIELYASQTRNSSELIEEPRTRKEVAPEFYTEMP